MRDPCLEESQNPQGTFAAFVPTAGGLIVILSFLASFPRRLPTSLLIYLAAFLAVAIFMLVNGTISV